MPGPAATSRGAPGAILTDEKLPLPGKHHHADQVDKTLPIPVRCHAERAGLIFLGYVAIQVERLGKGYGWQAAGAHIGLVRGARPALQRVVKPSGWWYGDVIRANGPTNGE